MKILIIDDEAGARQLLGAILQEQVEGAFQITEADNLLDGVAAIKSIQPEVVFSDIAMPGHSGLEMWKFLDQAAFRFSLIFTTAHDNHAIDAFEMSATDYLLKPLRPDRVAKAIEKARQNTPDHQAAYHRLQQLAAAMRKPATGKIKLPVNDGYVFMDQDSIMYLEADGMYTHFHTAENTKLTFSKPLKYYEDLLGVGGMFFRPHRKYLANLRFIKKYVKSDGGHILMANDGTIPVSKEKRQAFLKILDTM